MKIIMEVINMETKNINLKLKGYGNYYITKKGDK